MEAAIETVIAEARRLASAQAESEARLRTSLDELQRSRDSALALRRGFLDAEARLAASLAETRQQLEHSRREGGCWKLKYEQLLRDHSALQDKYEHRAKDSCVQTESAWLGNPRERLRCSFGARRSALRKRKVTDVDDGELELRCSSSVDSAADAKLVSADALRSDSSCCSSEHLLPARRILAASSSDSDSDVQAVVVAKHLPTLDLVRDEDSRDWNTISVLAPL